MGASDSYAARSSARRPLLLNGSGSSHPGRQSEFSTSTTCAPGRVVSSAAAKGAALAAIVGASEFLADARAGGRALDAGA